MKECEYCNLPTLDHIRMCAGCTSTQWHIVEQYYNDIFTMPDMELDRLKFKEQDIGSAIHRSIRNEDEYKNTVSEMMSMESLIVITDKPYRHRSWVNKASKLFDMVANEKRDREGWYRELHNTEYEIKSLMSKRKNSILKKYNDEIIIQLMQKRIVKISKLKGKQND